MELKLQEYIHLTGRIVCKTGLTIGAGEGFGIGDISRFVVRDSFRDNLPYIPGSSLKGKMRHLLELVLHPTSIDPEGKPHSCAVPDCPLCIIFGPGKPEDNQQCHRGPSRLIVRDAPLDIDVPEIKEYRKRTGDFTEIKAENVINRLDGQATPRRFERVPAGMQFKLNLIYRIFNLEDNGFTRTADQDRQDFQYVLRALGYVQQDYLGSSGSRGYGRIEIKLLPLSDLTHHQLVEQILTKQPGIGIQWITKEQARGLLDKLEAEEACDQPHIVKQINEN